MTDQRKRMEKALRRCAEAGVPDMVDLWPALREHLDTFSEAKRRRSSRRSKLVPRTRLGWVFAALATLLVISTGAYATGGIEDALNRVFGETVPNVRGTPVNKERSRGGITVTINRVYADSSYVAIGYTVEGLKELRRHWPGTSSYVNLSNSEGAAGSKEYALVDALWSGWTEDAKVPVPPKGAEVGTTVFEASERIKAGEVHRLRAEVYFVGRTGRKLENGALETKRVGRPFFFDFVVPVRDARVIKVDQTVKANGVPITLTQVVNSPVQTTAQLCFEPPGRSYDWPLIKTGIFQREAVAADTPVYHVEDAGGLAEDGCSTFRFDEALYAEPGMHQFTVTKLGASDPEQPYDPIEGPWRFSFEVPER